MVNTFLRVKRDGRVNRWRVFNGAVVKIKQYRGDTLVFNGNVKLFDDQAGSSGVASPSGGVTKGMEDMNHSKMLI